MNCSTLAVILVNSSTYKGTEEQYEDYVKWVVQSHKKLIKLCERTIESGWQARKRQVNSQWNCLHKIRI